MVMRPWSEEDKSAFHRAVDRQVWSHWSKKARFMLSPRSGPRVSSLRAELLRRCSNRGLTLSFDIRKVSSGGHWKVDVIRLSSDQTGRAEVDFTARIMTLFHNDTEPSRATNGAGASSARFMTVPHEFGHTLDVDDEYERSSRFLPDRKSVMNIGTEIRPRHLRLLGATLEKLVPGCAFTAMI